MHIDSRFYPEREAGGFTRVDGTHQFHARINALVRPDMVVMDFGAGRAAFADSELNYVGALRLLQGKAARVIGVDIDDAVMQNPTLDEAHVYDGVTIPLPDNSIDLIVSDYTFEHLTDPDAVVKELDRVLKPGGWLCARTPHLYSILPLVASVTPNRFHRSALKNIQPGRLEQDVFPTAYKLNTSRALRKFFPVSRWKHFVYTWSPEPGYHFNQSFVYWAFQVYQYLKKPFFGGEVLLAFLQKKPEA